MNYLCFAKAPMSRGTSWTVVVLASASALGGCAAPDEHGTPSVGDVQESGESIIRGTASTNPKVVLVQRTTGPGRASICTGTLLRSNIVLTARHCVGSQEGLGWTDHWIVTPTGEVIDVDDPENSVVEHEEADLAVVRLGGHVLINGTRNHWTTLHQGSVGSLVGKSVSCVGFGLSVCGGGGAGTQRKATLQVSSANSTSLEYKPNTSGQIQAAGDSGGPCFYEDKIVGVLRTAADSCNVARQTPVTTYAAWIRATTSWLMDEAWTDFTSASDRNLFQYVDLGGPANGQSDWVVDPGDRLWGAGALKQRNDIAWPGTLAVLDGHIVGDGSAQTWLYSKQVGWAALVFRYQNSRNFYAAVLESPAGAAESGIFKVKDSVWTRLATGNAALDGVTSLTAGAHGDELFAIMPGAGLVEATDSEFRDGRVGLAVNSLSDVRFFDFQTTL